MTEELSLACQWGRCQDCPDRVNFLSDAEPICLCHCHIDVPDTASDD